MYEELTASIYNCVNVPCVKQHNKICLARNEEDCRRELLAQAADAIEELSAYSELYEELTDKGIKTIRELLDKFPRWIPVTERLPEKRKWVLCWCVSNSQEVLRWENNEWYHDPKHVYFSNFVTHWMPLPELPKEET